MSRILRLLVVDDEAPARNRLKKLLGKIENVEVVGEAGDGLQAVAQIERLSPDAVLLDIRMPELDGLSVAKAIGDETHVIFTTAFDEYAVAAFETAAVDYLLKPVTAKRLGTALDRVRELTAPRESDRIGELLASLATGREAPRVAARSGDTLRVFDPREIRRFTTDEGYTLFQHEGRRYVLDESLQSLSERLATHGFLRVHRRELVNLDRVRAILKIDDGTVVELDDGQQASVSRRAVRELKRALGLVETD